MEFLAVEVDGISRASFILRGTLTAGAAYGVTAVAPFVSNAFVPTQGMPAWLRDFANWNPMSAIAAACRNLFGGSVPMDTTAWPTSPTPGTGSAR